MCSYRTYVPVIACLAIPGLELKAALRRTPTLALRPAALGPEPQGEPLLGPVTAAAEVPASSMSSRVLWITRDIQKSPSASDSPEKSAPGSKGRPLPMLVSWSARLPL